MGVYDCITYRDKKGVGVVRCAASAHHHDQQQQQQTAPIVLLVQNRSGNHCGTGR
jgi:hypothetical protein